MPNRGQNQDQNQKGRQQQNPGAFSPHDDEAQEADQTQLGAQNEPRKRKQQGDTALPDDQTMIEDEEAEDDEDDTDGIGARP